MLHIFLYILPQQQSFDHPNFLTCYQQAGNGVYEFISQGHPGFAEGASKNAVQLLCLGQGQTKGRPLKSINWGKLSTFGHQALA